VIGLESFIGKCGHLYPPDYYVGRFLAIASVPSPTSRQKQRNLAFDHNFALQGGHVFRKVSASECLYGFSRVLKQFSSSRHARCMLPSREIIRPRLCSLVRPSRALTTQRPTEAAEVHLVTSSKSPVTSANASQSMKGHGVPRPQLSVRYPYFVRRTKNGNLPVYTDTKGNGYLDVVHIQRIEGDIHVGHPLYPLLTLDHWLYSLHFHSLL